MKPMAPRAGVQHKASPTVVIAGGGIVGAALALDLAHAGVAVAMIEPGCPQHPDPARPPEARVAAIGSVSQALLQRLGVWRDLPAHRITPYRRMCVWDAAAAGDITFDAESLQCHDLGHIVEHAELRYGLWRALSAQPCCDTRPHEAVTAYRADPDAVTVQLRSGERLHSRLLVAADGGDSPLRALAGIGTLDRDYAQQGVVACIQTEYGHRHTAWQRFLPTGPLAVLPLWDNHSAIVWSTGHDHAAQLCRMTDRDVCRQLAIALDHRLGDIVTAGPRRAFPLRRRLARSVTAPRLALIGDAAHVIHPLAGQGVNLGLRDVQVLAQEIKAALNHGRDPGGQRVLQRYRRRRSGDIAVTGYAMDGFDRLFRSANPAIGLARTLALAWVDRRPALKRLLVRQAAAGR